MRFRWLIPFWACVSCASPFSSRPLAREQESRDGEIDLYEARVRRTTNNSFALAKLGALYLSRSRETADPHDAVLAEEAARRSLHETNRNHEAAQQILIASLVAQQRFDEALSIAEALRDSNPVSATRRATVAEIQMLVGRYDSARAGFGSLTPYRRNPFVAVRLARWAELRGHVGAARLYLRSAIAAATRDSAGQRGQLAELWLQAGDVELRDERYDAADSAYTSGLNASPDDYRLLSGLARVAMARRQWREAARLGENALASARAPATLALIGDAYYGVGDTAKANEFARRLDVADVERPGDRRAWSLFQLDRGKHVAEIELRIRDEMKTRQDIYAYDLLAWSLHKQGRELEAAAAMATAMSQGTRDPLLSRHAAAIVAACQRAQ